MASGPKSAKIDFKPEIYQILLLKAQETHRSVSELVNEAISLYFSGTSDTRDKNNGGVLAREAHRQSLLVSEHRDPLDDIWEANIDDSDWRE